MTTARVLWGLALAVALAHAVVLLSGGAVDGIAWTPAVVFALCAAAVGAAALADRPRRAAWLALAAGLALYAGGIPVYELHTAEQEAPGFPAPSDLLWLALYPLALAAIVLLVRAQGARVRSDLWLDGAIAGLVAAAAGVTVISVVVIDPQAAMHAAPANLVFALCDLLIVGFGVGACALLGWRPPRTLLGLVAGFLALGVQDAAYLHALVTGTFESGTLLDTCWLVAVVAICGGVVWPRPSTAQPTQPRPGALVAFPIGFALAAVALAARMGWSDGVSHLVVVLTTLALVTVVVRLGLTFRAHLIIIATTEREAVTDDLTGLGNRRKLLHDAQAAVAEARPGKELTLAIFDLDGFKGYNDTYGHPAGDDLLARLGTKLALALLPWGQAYRLGGDEFCVLLRGTDFERRQGLAAAAAALTEEGEAFSIASSYGAAVVPGDARDLTAALNCADTRLYAAKDRRPAAAGRQACDALRQILVETEPELDHHHEIVRGLAERVGRRLKLTAEELHDVVRAAELHDIGKIAIPDAILHKPGPLDDEEWRFMRRHTTIGERFLSSIPSLQGVARLVRSSHERWDGGGYPDGLAGDAIPLGARIVFACDAYDAMTTDRPYRMGMSPAEALEELRRHAGTQFDPDVVEALCAELRRSARFAVGPRAR